MATTLGPYSPAFQAGGFLFCSGQIGLDANNQLVEDFEAQVLQALANVRDLLTEYDVSLEQVCKTTLFLTDLSNFASVNELYSGFFGEHRPARSSIGVSALPKGASFEIEVIAHLRAT